MKDDPHGMRILLVSVHNHQGPLPIRPLQSIGRNQGMTRGIVEISRRREDSVYPVTRLHPLQCDKLAGEELG